MQSELLATQLTALQLVSQLEYFARSTQNDKRDEAIRTVHEALIIRLGLEFAPIYLELTLTADAHREVIDTVLPF